MLRGYGFPFEMQTRCCRAKLAEIPFFGSKSLAESQNSPGNPDKLTRVNQMSGQMFFQQRNYFRFNAVRYLLLGDESEKVCCMPILSSRLFECLLYNASFSKTGAKTDTILLCRLSQTLLQSRFRMSQYRSFSRCIIVFSDKQLQ